MKAFLYGKGTSAGAYFVLTVPDKTRPQLEEVLKTLITDELGLSKDILEKLFPKEDTTEKKQPKSYEEKPKATNKKPKATEKSQKLLRKEILKTNLRWRK